MVLKTQNNNVIKKYRYLFPSFVYLRKMCHDKGRFLVKQKKCGLVIFFSLKLFLKESIFKSYYKFLCVLWMYFLLYGLILLAGTRWKNFLHGYG